MVNLLTLLYKYFRSTGTFSWLSVKIGLWFGTSNRRQLLVWFQAISPDSKKLLENLEKKSTELPQLTSVDRVEHLSGEEFQLNYALMNKPVVITNAVKTSQLTSWSFDALKENFGELLLWVRKGRDYDKMRRYKMHLRDYIDSMLAGKQDYYMANNLLPIVMYGAVDIPTQFAGSNQFKYERAQLWIGGESTGSHLHRDLFDNFVLLLNGSKTFYLASPDESESLYTWEVHSTLNSSKFDFLAPDYHRFPLAKKAHFVIIKMQPGDLLYVPCGWFHQVINHEPSCSISIFGERLVATALQRI